jgi:ABC-2 type transport system ATP-binding protein
MSRLLVEDVAVRYGSVKALDGLSFECDGGIVGLLGPNGAGKTTLLRVIATVLAPDSGRVACFGWDAKRHRERTEIRRRLGYMPQEPGFYQSFTCFDFLDYIAILKEHVDPAARHEEVRRVIEITGLANKSTTRIRKLSGGMRRRLALAQALLGEPSLLLLDEPTAGLDPEQRFRFRELVTSLGEGRVVLLSSHQTEDVAAICDRVLVMSSGRIMFDGSPRQLAAVAEGKVWLSPNRPDEARLFWRTTDGLYRGVGEPPAAARLIEPGIEDGYLLLVGSAALSNENAA